MTFEIAVVSRNTDFYLYNLLVSIRDRLPPEAISCVHVWDNGSDDATLPMLERFRSELPALEIHASPSNDHHGPALDALLRHACKSEWILLLDSDTEVRRNFLPDLPVLSPDPPAFIGQVHPLMPHLYAYLAHLLVHRPTYLSLPRFRRDGAPGADYFREIERRRLPWARFRWTDFIEHFGQGTLREMHRRGERNNELYRFAARHLLPRSPEAERREERLRDSLRNFLSAGFAARPRSVRAPSVDGAATRPRPSASVSQATRWPALAPTNRVVRRAERLGLGMAPQTARLLFRQLRPLRPRRVLEVGSPFGGSMHLWSRASSSDAVLVRLGLPRWELDDPWEPGKVAELIGMARQRQRIGVVRRDPLDPLAAKEVDEILGVAPIDFLFWYADRASPPEASALITWTSRVRPGGLVAIYPRDACDEAFARLGNRQPPAEIGGGGDSFAVGLLFPGATVTGSRIKS